MLAERWNDGKWVVQSIPNPPGSKDSILYGVWCSSARACAAVGQDLKGTLAERWNGRKWVVQSTPNPSGSKDIILVAVSCSSPKACTAVGDYHNRSGADVTLAERWNGKKWALQPTPNPVTGTHGSALVGVSCSSATSCTAVGEGNITDSKSDTLAERWNGKKWALQSTPNPSDAGASHLKGVSCSSATACTSVGPYVRRSGAEPTLAERYS